MKETLLVVCPGRGSYTREELGYLRQHRPSIDGFISRLDSWRMELGQPTITELDDAEKFSAGIHTPGENASILIHACAMADFMAIDRDRYDVVAVTGNSMGWYLTLGAAGAVDEAGAFLVVNTMGSMMRERVIGGQIIYPVMDADWRLDPRRQEYVRLTMEEVRAAGGVVHDSIYLGGYLVIGGDESGLRHMLARLEKIDDRYPFKLVNHAAFHTPMLKETSQKGFAALPPQLFHRSNIPMVDGRGHIWQPWSTDAAALRSYTLGHQVTEPYDFSAAIRVGVREFAPDRVVLLGPGDSLGGAIGQVLVNMQWRGISSKAEFVSRQKSDPILLAMGRPEQRAQLIH